MEDSAACIHGSRGQRKPVGEHVRSEPFIVAGLAKATLSPNPNVDWDKWIGDYSLVRDAIEATYPDQFKHFNERLFIPGGFPRPLAARERKWKTPNGKANFTVPESFSKRREDDGDIYRLITVRADGQFNTTIYNEDDRFRGVKGGRNVILMNEADIAKLDLRDGDASNYPPRRTMACSVSMVTFKSCLTPCQNAALLLLPRMQCADPALALRQGKQGTRIKVHSSSDHVAAQGCGSSLSAGLKLQRETIRVVTAPLDLPRHYRVG